MLEVFHDGWSISQRRLSPSALPTTSAPERFGAARNLGGKLDTICNGTVIGCGASLQLCPSFFRAGGVLIDVARNHHMTDSFSLRSEQRQYARPKKMFDLLALFVVCVESAPSGAKERDISTLASFVPTVTRLGR